MHWLIFLDRSRNISRIQNFYSLPPFTQLSFQKLIYPPLCRRLSQLSLVLLGVVLLSTPKIATRLNILCFASAQRVELYAVVRMLRDFPQQLINLLQ
jgi:hypothetical protein